MTNFYLNENSKNTILSTGVTVTCDGVNLLESNVALSGQEITIEAPNGKEFYYTKTNNIEYPTVYLNNSSFNQGRAYFTLSNDNKTAKWIVTDLLDGHRWTDLKITLRNEQPIFGYTLTQNDIDNLDSNLIELSIDGINAFVGQKILVGQELIANLPTNKEFKMISVGGENKSSIYFKGYRDNNYTSYLDFELSNDNHTATLIFSKSDPTLTAYTEFFIETYDVKKVTGDGNIFLIDDNKLVDIVKQRFIQSEEQIIDYGVYILGLISLPFKIDDSLIMGEKNIPLGNRQLTTLAPELNTDLIRFNIGDIEVPKTFNNFLDYYKTTVLLHIPKTPPIELDSDFVIGHSINIEYIVDCYNGNAQVNIRSSKTGEIFKATTVDIGINVPYIGSTISPNVENVNIVKGGENDVTIPFIEIFRYEAINVDGEFNTPIKDYGLIGDNSGYIKVDDINIVSKATNTEKSVIYSALKSGVIIK